MRKPSDTPALFSPCSRGLLTEGGYNDEKKIHSKCVIEKSIKREEFSTNSEHTASAYGISPHCQLISK